MAPRDNDLRSNPLLDEFTLPHGAFPFDKVKTEHFMPAFEAALADARVELEEIKANRNAPTFANTIEALEFTGETLGRVQRFFNVIAATRRTDEISEIEEAVGKMTTQYGNDLYMDAALFARVKAVYDQKDTLSLTGEQKVLLEETYRSFIDSGALLDETAKQELRDISERLSELTTKFENNSVKSLDAYQKVITDEKELAGVPARAKNNYKAAAEEAGLPEGSFLIKLLPPPLAILQYSENRALREEIFRANNSIACSGEYDNRPVILEIVKLRHREAQIMGYPSFAASELSDKMLDTPEKVKELLEKNLAAYRPAAEKFLGSVKAYAQKADGLTDIQPWDFQYYSRKLKEDTFKIDMEETRAYFDLEEVLKGVRQHAEKLFNIKLTEVKGKYPTFHPDVKVFEVADKNDGHLIGLYYADYYARPGEKSDGAWMDSLRDRGLQGGVDQIPIVYNACNFDKPTKEQPTLISLDEVTTTFHEFGHALHALLSEGTYTSLTGTNVKHDFVEAPSQIQENWAKEKEVLDTFAVHHKTGEKIPAALVEKMLALENFDAAYLGLRQTFFGLMDMAWHAADPATFTSVEAVEDSVVARASLFPRVAGPFCANFGHIFSGGYASGYYGYKWSEVLEADMFTAFKKNGLYDPATAQKLRTLLSKGGTEDPMDLFTAMMGRRPDPDALFRREGLLPPAGGSGKPAPGAPGA